MKGLVLRIFTAPSAGAPMEEQRSVRTIPGRGLAGDRYAEQVGSWSKTKVGQRDVTLISANALIRAKVVHGMVFEPNETRRNLLVSVGINELNALVGKQFSVGGVLMEGTELCTPCKRPSKLVGKEGFDNVFAGAGGLRARILSSGIIRIDSLLLPA